MTHMIDSLGDLLIHIIGWLATCGLIFILIAWIICVIDYAISHFRA